LSLKRGALLLWLKQTGKSIALQFEELNLAFFLSLALGDERERDKNEKW
jgi:hypothetical protein